MAVLQLLTGTDPTQQFTLDRERAVLGRHPDCDIVLDAAAVSRQHAHILQEGEDFYVEDLHSRNGTFVNGEMIQARRKLDDGDRLKICDLSFRFFSAAPTGDSPAPSLATAGPGDLASSFVMEDAADTGNSTIMTKLEVSSGRSGVRLVVNPEAKLRAMVEIAHNLGRSVAVDEVLPKLLDSIFKIFIQADRGFVILRATPEGPLVPKAIKQRRQGEEDQIRVSRTIINQVMLKKEAILSADAANDSRFQSSQSIADLRIRSVMCAPLVNSEGQALGIIQVDTADQRQRFQKDDLDLLASIAAQAAIAIDNAQLHESMLKQQGVQRDLELAHKVQRGLLPAEPPRIPGYQFFDFYEPASQVGGDYYDYIELPGNRLAVVLADVSGKGVSAALLMAKLSGEVRYCLASEPTPAGALTRINGSFSRSGWQDRFVTFVLAVIDLNEHTVTIVNAGHMPPYLRHGAGLVEPVGEEIAGIPLGVDGEFSYAECTIRFEPGDLLAMFTDGISEAMNKDSELYGLERLRTQIAAEAANADSFGRLILEDVKRFVGGRPQSDDMCLACFGRLA